MKTELEEIKETSVFFKLNHKKPFANLEELKAMPKPPMLESRVNTIGAFIELDWKTYKTLRLSIWEIDGRVSTDLSTEQVDKLINDLQEIRKSLK